MKAYILSTCSTCQRILKEINWEGEIHDIKKDGVPTGLLDKIKKQEGSYEVAFSRRAMKYKSMGLKDKTLTEKDYKDLIRDEYTFLKRPVFLINDVCYIGNSKKNVLAVKDALGH